MSHTNINPQAIQPDLLKFYDSLMSGIEPELMSENIDIADMIHDGETAQERADRYKHYEQSFAVFEKRFDVVMGMWRDELLAFKDSSKETLKNRVRDQSSKELHQLHPAA